MISIDTLRRRNIGHYGGGNTEFLDGLLEDSYTLDNHQSCSNWTYASILCVLTGRYNEENNFFPLGGARMGENDIDRVPPLPDEIPIFAEWLRSQGFASGLVSANGFFGPNFNVGNRYDEAQISVDAADALVDSSLTMLDEVLLPSGQPWLLHTHFIDPHTPYTPPGEYVFEQLDALPSVPWNLMDEEELINMLGIYPGLDEEAQALIRQYIDILYTGELAFLDDQLERLFGELEARGVLEDTLVVFWSDHGEQFWEHNNFGHHSDIYSEETDALAAFWAKGLEASSWTGPTTHVDLLPTLLCLMNLPPFEPASGAIVGEAELDRPRFSSSLHREISQSSVGQGDWRLVYHWTGALELYNRAVDPTEENNIASDYPDDVMALWSLVEPFVEVADALNPDQEAIPPL